MRTLFTLTSLLLSTTLLLIGHGMQMTLLPLRGTELGLSDFMIGLSASAYFAGFVVATLTIPQIIARVGHIRSFAVLAATLVSSLLLLSITGHWLAWLFLRFVIGAMLCGLYTVIESWLNDQASTESRGQVLAVYTFLVLSAMALGQLFINIAPVASALPFVLAAVFMALSIVPVGLTRRLQPAPMAAAKPRFLALYAHSRPAFLGAIFSGLVVGSFWSLGAVFASRTSASLSDVTHFITAGIVGGAALQYPIGWLSDRFPRYRVLALLALLGALASAAVALSVGLPWHLWSIFAFGAMTMPLYAVSLAIAADHSKPGEFVQIGTSVLLLNAVAAALAPFLMGYLMDLYDAPALFWTCAGLLLVASVLIAIPRRATPPPEVEEQVPFSAAATEMAPTGFDMDPRSPDDSHGEIEPVGEPDFLQEAEEQQPEEAPSEGRSDEKDQPN